LMVSNDIGPKVRGNITEVLTQAGQVSGPLTLSIGPSKSFNIIFPSDTFSSNGKPLSYIALLSDRTPLPAWISFDASSLHFAGTTPPTESTVRAFCCNTCPLPIRPKLFRGASTYQPTSKRCADESHQGRRSLSHDHLLTVSALSDNFRYHAHRQ
jgi:hypothetical protein